MNYNTIDQNHNSNFDFCYEDRYITLTDEEYDEVYNYDNHSNEDRIHGHLYIGNCEYSLNNYIFDISVSSNCFFYFPYSTIKDYMPSNIEIMQVEIIDDCYYVVLKTFWIRLVQRTWKKIYAKRTIVINIRKSLYCQQYYELKGEYPIHVRYLPSIYGMITNPVKK